MNYQRWLPWVMWLFPLAFFGFQFILRLFPGLVMNEFLDKYTITATDFGTFASLYYLGYAGMQIPLALLLDKYGARKIVSACAIVCGLATLMFVLFNSWPMALLSRFLIGAASVVGFLGTSKVISQWFPALQYTRMVGFTFSIGLLGALYGGRPVSMMIENIGWENVTLTLGSVALVLGLATFLFLRNKPLSHVTPEKESVSLKALFSQKSLIILAFSNLLMVGALEGFADVWGVSYLMISRGLTKVEASGITSYIFVGMLFGGPLLAYFAEKFKAHFAVTAFCGVSMAALLLALFYCNTALPEWAVISLMFCVGLLCCYQVIVFSIGTKMVSPAQISITVAFLNCINMLGGAFFHSLIGRLMDFFNGGGQQGVAHYSLNTYTLTLTVIPLCSILGALLVLWSKRQHLAKQYQHNIIEQGTLA